MRPILVAVVVVTAACGEPPAAPPSLVLAASANGVLDAGDPDHVGSAASLRLQGTSLVTLVRFDQAAILRGVKQGALHAAKLRLHLAAGTDAGAPVTATRVRRYWGEASATWTCPEDTAPANGSPDCAHPWNGGDLEPAPTGQSNGADASGFVEVDVTADLQAYLSGTAPNFGWAVRPADPTAPPLAFDPRSADASRAPQLALTFDASPEPDLVRVAADHWSFARSVSHVPVVATGVNYDHDNTLAPCPLLIEEYWHDRWDVVERSLQAIADLGFHVVRIHLQFQEFIAAPGAPSEASLLKLDQLVRAAQRHGLLLDVTGLAHYRREQVPAWFAALDDDATMDAEASFWAAIAARYPYEPAVFSYDLQNEPFVSSGDTNEVVSPAFGMCDPDGAGPEPTRGFAFVNNHFRHAGARWTAWVQAKYGSEAALQQAWPDYPRSGESWTSIGRPNFFSSQQRGADSWQFAQEMGRLWTMRMAAAIRAFDGAHLVTVGLAHPLPFQDQNAVDANELLFYPSFAPHYLRDTLDFISVHVYPKRYGSGDNEPLSEMVLRGAYVGKPVVLEETFQYISDEPTYRRFMSRALVSASGWYTFYWGQTPAELRATGDPIAAAIAGWIDENATIARGVTAAAVVRTPATTQMPVSIVTLLQSQSARLALSSAYASAAAQDQFLDPVLGP